MTKAWVCKFLILSESVPPFISVLARLWIYVCKQVLKYFRKMFEIIRNLRQTLLSNLGQNLLYE